MRYLTLHDSSCPLLFLAESTSSRSMYAAFRIGASGLRSSCARGKKLVLAAIGGRQHVLHLALHFKASTKFLLLAIHQTSRLVQCFASQADQYTAFLKIRYTMYRILIKRGRTLPTMSSSGRDE